MDVKATNLLEDVIVVQVGAGCVALQIEKETIMALSPERLISNLKKRHKPTEKFDSKGLTKLVLCTEGKTKKGAGIIEHIWELGDGESVWISDGYICLFVKPDSKLISTKLDRYANEIEEKEHEIVKLNPVKERVMNLVRRKNKTKGRK